MRFSRQRYWSGLPFPSPGHLPNSGIKPGSPAPQADSLPTELQGKPSWGGGAYSVIQSCPTLCNPMNCNPPGSSVSISFLPSISCFRESSRPRDRTQASWFAGRFFPIWAISSALCVLWPSLACSCSAPISAAVVTRCSHCVSVSSSFFVIYLFILFLVALGLPCCVPAFSSCGKRGRLFVALCGFLTAVASRCRARALGLEASVAAARTLESVASAVLAQGISCSVACGIFPDQGLNPCPLQWWADSHPLHHQGSPSSLIQTMVIPD